jgi:hypothetical protein
LAYEYDGVGVFADRDDPELPLKLGKISSFIRKQSVNRFQVAESMAAAAGWTGYRLSVVTLANAPPHGLTKAIKRIGQPSGSGRVALSRV